jgi:hypothetical protein
MTSDATQITRTARVPGALAAVATLACFSILCLTVPRYPLAPWLLAAALALYGVALWRWPSIWLVVMPAILPALDLTPWTGWMFLSEPDLFALMTIGILSLRTRPRRSDLFIGGLPGVAVALIAAFYLLGIALGVARSGLADGSSNPYLEPANALRLAKGFFIALALTPFLRQRLRPTENAQDLFAVGMVAGLCLVALATFVERALFLGLFDFSSGYRVVATFSAMHLGGGIIDAYLVLSLPFLIVCLVSARPVSVLAMIGIGAAAGYALVVTFARAAYASAFFAGCATLIGWFIASRRAKESSLFIRTLPFFLVGLAAICVAVASVGTDFMWERLERILPDLHTRERNWVDGLALRDHDVATALFGMGLGTYPRVSFTRSPVDWRPTNFVVKRDGGYRYLSITAGSNLYFEQKVSLAPDQRYRLSVALRSHSDSARLLGLLCEKWLLYSLNCRGASFVPRAPDLWQDFTVDLSTAGLDQHAVLGLLRRPLTLSFFDPVPGTTVDIGHVWLFDAHGHDVIADGDFAKGTERWYFSDDAHIVWRIESQYLMILFESGALGLAAFLFFVGVALRNTIRAIFGGNRLAAAIAGSLLGFLGVAIFDYVLEAPRLATLFYLVCFLGLSISDGDLRRRAMPRSGRDSQMAR